MTVPFNPAAYSGTAQQIESSRLFGAAAVGRIKTAPGDYLSHAAANIWLLWNTSIYPAALPDVARIVPRVISRLVFVGGILGLIAALKSNCLRRDPIPLPALLLYFPAIHIGLHTEARYTAAARPLLLMFVAVLVSFAMQRLRPMPACGEGAHCPAEP